MTTLYVENKYELAQHLIQTPKKTEAIYGICKQQCMEQHLVLALSVSPGRHDLKSNLPNENLSTTGMGI